MRTTTSARLLAGLFALALAGPAAGATLLVNSSGHLTGAKGVHVNAQIYDVAFVDGTCSAVFGACDSAHFAFTSQAGASAAAQSLLDQVFINGPSGQFDSHSGLTLGCAARNCWAIVPYSPILNSRDFAAIAAKNANDPAGDMIGSYKFGATTDMGLRSNAVFAVFSPDPGPVPEPATWAMMLLGFGAVGFATRRSAGQAFAGA